MHKLSLIQCSKSWTVNVTSHLGLFIDAEITLIIWPIRSNLALSIFFTEYSPSMVWHFEISSLVGHCSSSFCWKLGILHMADRTPKLHEVCPEFWPAKCMYDTCIHVVLQKWIHLSNSIQHAQQSYGPIHFLQYPFQSWIYWFMLFNYSW